ncbi:anti-sigma regulatory factor (Ser/Thr protein kinase) [Kitasatospora sp. MAP12-15]|uniref:ATP-binding protein n=1 Tax=unclassified Kitasatospora TaxID=2633591 RepID=UPI002473A2FC|nr:ATP-binding protein [Kitasatospora sp. MAP12-44]MDH6110908.1 anti-sigma regulatory factor (Ser/Thr protein kinase) [Kitasatospora sp. MAP12-44]
MCVLKPPGQIPSWDLHRELLGNTLTAAGWQRDDRRDAETVLYELLANAYRHGEGTPTVVLVLLTARALRLIVADESPREPIAQPASAEAEFGRGLLMVTGLADAWGVERRTYGKAVWAHLSKGAAA